LNKKTFEQLEYKLAAPLNVNETVTIGWRTNLTDAFVSAGTIAAESTTDLSGYLSVNFDRTQWVQLQAILNSDQNSTSSFVRLFELRLR
jgi:hypothetical protein